MQRQPHKEYATILKNYMAEFRLEAIDISYLSGVNEKTINALLDRNGGIELGSLEAISKIFSMRYFELGNPHFKMPKRINLPEKTLDRISYRENEGAHIKTSNKKLNLTQKIIVILSRYPIGKEFLSKEIAEEILKCYDNQKSTGEVLARLKGSRLKEYIHETDNIYEGGKGPNSTYFCLTKGIPAPVIAEAKQEVGVGKWSGK